MRVARFVWLVLSAAAAAGVVPAALGPRAFAAGDPAAKAEVTAAFQKLKALPGFRIKWVNPMGSGISEFTPPDKWHYTGQMALASVEVYQIGKEIRMHTSGPGAPAAWQCAKTGMAFPFPINTDKLQRDLADVNRRPDTVIDGTPVHAYADTKDIVELYVDSQSGLPYRSINSDKPPNGYTADFYDFGAPIAFTPPPCGQHTAPRTGREIVGRGREAAASTTSVPAWAVPATSATSSAAFQAGIGPLLVAKPFDFATPSSGGARCP